MTTSFPTLQSDIDPCCRRDGRKQVEKEIDHVSTVVFPKGEDPTRVTSSTQSGGILEFTISISPDETTLTYAVERQEGGNVIASQKATIRLASQGE